MMKQKYLQFILILTSVTLACSYFSCNSGSRQITYHQDIEKIIGQHCVKCHHSDGPAPFSLMDYYDVSKRAKLIAHVTKSRFMPPWPADHAYSNFTDDNFLSDHEIDLIERWASTGATRGDDQHSNSKTIFSKGSLLGKPDLVIKMPENFLVKGNNTDQFFVMKFPYELEKDTFIRAIEFVPDTQNLVHHMNGFLIHYQDGKKKNVHEGKWWINTDEMDYADAYQEMKIPQDDGAYPTLTPSVCNYLPGVLPTLYPEGIGGFMMKRKGAIFLKDIHYGPQPIDHYDHSYFNVFFAPKPPERRTSELQLGTLGISPIEPPLIIPPDTVMTFKTKLTIPRKISILTINPHMHLLGKSFLAYALTPVGDTIRLIRINQWDFRWQYFYTFNNPVIIPDGSVIYVEGVYDNTKNNPNNPFNPPRTVSERNGSMKTSDEMFQFIITYLPYKRDDEKINLRSSSLER